MVLSDDTVSSRHRYTGLSFSKMWDLCSTRLPNGIHPRESASAVNCVTLYRRAWPWDKGAYKWRWSPGRTRIGLWLGTPKKQLIDTHDNWPRKESLGRNELYFDHVLVSLRLL